MTIREIYNNIRTLLRKHDIDSPAQTAGVLLCSVLKCEISYIYTHYDEEISEEKQELLNGFIKRLCDNEPIDYIIGERAFMNYIYKVGKGVLVPRPETELLVEKGYEFINEFSEKNPCDEVKILDLCTGSGCIAVSLTKMIKEKGSECTATGIDISDEALVYARANAKNMGVSDRVDFIKGDVFDLDKYLKKDVNTFTVLLTNPPYIRSKDIVKLDRKVRNHEPVTALDGGVNGLHFYEQIIPQSKYYLIKGGLLGLEIGYGQSMDIVRLIEAEESYEDINVYKDIAGIERVITCRLI